ncbi:MAG TPA: hypothetical protein PK526_03930 [bacterium]|nr:hypothetical protein [bacterium]
MAEKIDEFRNALVNTVAHGVKELELKRTDVSCFFPADLMSKGLGEEIVIFVDGLMIKPKRTKEVRDRLAQAISQITLKWFPDVNLIECFIRPFDLEQGFAAHFKQ